VAASVDLLPDAGGVITEFERAVSETIFAPDAFAGYTKFLRDFLAAPPGPTLATLESYPRLREMLLGRVSTDAASETVAYVFFGHSLSDRQGRDAAVRAVRRSVGDIPGVTLTGAAVISHDLEGLISAALPRLLAIAAGAVFVASVLAFRRVRDVVLTTIPALAGIGGLVIYMSIADEKLNMVNLVAFPLLLGICVDYGIFTVQIARAAPNQGGFRAGLAAGTHAFVMTSGTTIIGFGSLITVSTPAVQGLGRAVAVGMVVCLAATLFLLVPLLRGPRS
jgi:uncharacterized protein